MNGYLWILKLGYGLGCRFILEVASKNQSIFDAQVNSILQKNITRVRKHNTIFIFHPMIPLKLQLVLPEYVLTEECCIGSNCGSICRGFVAHEFIA